MPVVWPRTSRAVKVHSGSSVFLPEITMKVCIILGLLFVAANGEKKINLEDIERDNLRAESKGNVESDQGDVAKYSATQDNSRERFESSTPKYSASTSPPDTYLTSQHSPDIKYSQPVEYKQSNGYSVNEYIYSDKEYMPPQRIRPLPYRNKYRQYTEVLRKNPPASYQSPRFFYQPEVTVGNQYQSIQQKAAIEKYLTNTDKGIFYVEVPMNQLLSYYPLDTDTKTSQSQTLLQQYSGNEGPKISIPVYNPLNYQKQYVTPTTISYQTQPSYASAYIQPFSSAYFPKISKNAAPVASNKPVSPILPTPSYIQPDTQSKKYLYTQAYLQPQTQYVEQLTYNQPAADYTPGSSFYTDFYNQAVTYIQDNSLHGHANQYNAEPTQQLYISPLVAQQLSNQVSQNVPLEYAKTPKEPSTRFVPPQYAAQEFKGDVTHLPAVSSSTEDHSSSAGHSSSTEPRSLLDTYIPSKVIAAQDSSRYRERPIQLESGFLPSKLNFVHKKRAAN